MYNVSSTPFVDPSPEILEILPTLNPILFAIQRDLTLTPIVLRPEKLAEPLLVEIGESEAIFTHHLGNAIFGDEPSLKRYQNIMNTLEERWPALPKLINSQQPHNRIAIFTTSSSDVLKQAKAGGAWGPFSSSEPRLKQFNAGIIVDVNSGKASIKYVGHEWWHEVQSVLNTCKSGKNPCAIPISMSAYLNAADEAEIVTCWWKGYEKYRAAPMSSNDPRHLIYGKPAKHYEKFYKASQVGHQAEAASAWTEFTHEIGSYMASARLEHGHKAIQEHAWELGQLIDNKLGIIAFTEPSPARFKTQLLSFVKRHTGSALEVLGLGLDVYHEYTLLPDDHPSRNAHALINGTARNVIGGSIAFTSLNEALLHDVSHLGTGADAARMIEETVGEDRLQEILFKGRRALMREELVLPNFNGDAFTGEEREIFFAYQNACLKNVQELGQGFITELYDSVKQKITDFFYRRSPDLEAFKNASNTLGVEIKAQLSNRNIWGDPKQQELLATSLLERADQVFSEVPKNKHVLPSEQIAEALTPAKTDAPAVGDRVAYVITDPEKPAAEHPHAKNLIELHQKTQELNATTDAPVVEDHVANVIPDPEKPAAEHPHAKNLIELHQKAQELNAALEAAIQEERPVDEATLESIHQLTDRTEKVADHLQKEWDKKEEYYVRTMQCVGVIANQLYQQFQQDRQDDAQSAALKEKQRVIESQKSELRRSAQPEVSYVDVERFAHSEFHPKTLLEAGRETSSLLDRLNELKDRRSTREEALDDVEQLFDDMKRSDKIIQEQLQRKLKHQRDIGKRFGRLTTILGASAGIMAACACPPAFVATVATAGAVSQIGQAVIGNKTDRTVAKLQKAQDRSLELHQKVAQTAKERQYELSVIEGQMQQVYQILLTQNSLDNKGFRKTLKSIIDDRQQKIEKLEEELKSHQEHLKSVNDAVDREQKSVEHVKKHYKKMSRFQGNPEERVQAYERAAALDKKAIANREEKLYYEGRINTTQGLLDDLKRQNADDKHRLKQEEFLAPMKEQIESVILKEQRLLDFDRHPAGDLTQLGLAQQQLRENLWEHYMARQAERKLIFSSSQAAKGLSQELGHLLGSRKPAFAIDLVDQIYRIYDLKKHFEECAIPQFQKFVEVLQLNDGRGFTDKVKQLNVGDLVTGFVIPGVQLVAASLAVMRLCQALTSRERLSPEQEFLINVVEKAFQGHQNLINEQFKELKEHLDSNQTELTEELKQLRSDIGCIGIELCKLVQNAKKEIQEQLHSQNFRDFKFEVDTIAGKWRKKDLAFWGQFSTIAEEKKEQKALAYLAKLEAALATCKEEHLNGLTSNGSRGWKLRFALECLADGPQYVTGALAQELGLAGPVPNMHLFFALCESIRRLEASCPYDAVRQRLNRLRPQLEEYTARLEQLSEQREPALREALQARENYIQEILSVTERMHTIGLAVQEAIVRRQIVTLLDAHEAKWLGDNRVGERKFLLSNLARRSPISTDFAPDLVSLENTILLQWAHSEAKRIGYYGAGVGGLFGIPAGPAGVAVLGGLGGAATYAVTTVGSIGAFALGKSIAWLLGDDNLYRQREIKQIFNSPISSIMENEKYSGTLADLKFEFRVDYSNQYRKYEVTACKLSHMLKDTLFEASKEYSQPTNARAFIAFKIEGDFGRLSSLTHRVLFAPESLIQRKDVESIAPAPDTKDYAERVRRMLRSYFSCLRAFLNRAAMAEDNPFKTIDRESHFIHSTTGEFLPLALPQKLLQATEEILLAENFELMATETGSLVPSFHFRKEPLGDRYEFLLEYRFVKPTGGQLEEYISFQLATFDPAVVESFKQVTFRQQGNDYDYAIGEPNLQEFLLQAFYGNLFGLGLPGKGTTRLQKANLFIPREVPFDGLHELFARYPGRALHYTMDYSGENPKDLVGGSPVELRGRESFRFWLDAQEGKHRPESLQKAEQAYAQKLHLAKALFELFSIVDSESLDEIFTERLGFFSPSKPELAQAHALMRIRKRKTR